MIYVLFQIVMSIASWSWVVFILSLGARYLNFNNKVLAYGNEAVLPLKKNLFMGLSAFICKKKLYAIAKIRRLVIYIHVSI